MFKKKSRVYYINCEMNFSLLSFVLTHLIKYLPPPINKTLHTCAQHSYLEKRVSIFLFRSSFLFTSEDDHKEGGNMMLLENTIQWKAAIGGLHYLFALVITLRPSI